jgi:hypothetical protein
MKTKLTTPPAPAVSTVNPSDSTKLVSLLALATGAVALPQTGNADIIYTDLNSSSVVVGYGGVASFEFTLPGTTHLGLARQSHTSSVLTATFPVTFRTVVAGDFGGGASAGVRGLANGFAAVGALGATWNQGAATWNYVTVGLAQQYGHTPNSGYDHQYLAWAFQDSSQAGSPWRYGWADVSLSIGNVNSGIPGSGPNVTIWGYAYDNTGAKPNLGIVPEPSSISLLVLGAMAFGARGLRAWRRDRAAACES